MARSRTSQAAKPIRSAGSLQAAALGNPDLYPDEFKAWLPRFLSQNLNMIITTSQMPHADSDTQVGSGGVAPVFANGWVNYDGGYAPASYYRDPYRRVFLGGIVKSGTIGSTIFVLPSGYAPSAALVFVVASGNAVGNITCGICTVNADGSVVATGGSNVYFSLSGISFRQGA